ncbi:MAG: hypothetical protein IRZ29_08640, partial [Thermoflavifilum sp.]|nr:hypothetical protein [Thermoflavifilum sp.]
MIFPIKEKKSEREAEDLIDRARINEQEAELTDKLLEEIEKCVEDDPDEKYGISYCLGVYISYDNLGIAQGLHLNIRRYRFILLCPERIEKSANEVDIDPTLLFMKVLYHELGHAFMDDKNLNYYDEAWCMTIEEGLANTIALERFPKWKERKQIIRFIQQQPLEYRSSLAMPFAALFIYLNPARFKNFKEWEDKFCDFRHWGFKYYEIGFHKLEHQLTTKGASVTYSDYVKAWEEVYDRLRDIWDWRFGHLFEDSFSLNAHLNGYFPLYPKYGYSSMNFLLGWKHFPLIVSSLQYKYFATKLLEFMNITDI